jgi:hypothetical protein
LAAISKSAANNIAQRMKYGPAKRLFNRTPLPSANVQIPNIEDAVINVALREPPLFLDLLNIFLHGFN